MDDTTAGFSAQTDPGGGEASTSSAGSLTGAPSDSQPVDGGELVSSFLQGLEEKPADSQGAPAAPAPEQPEPVSSAGDGGEEKKPEDLVIPETDDDLSKLTDQTAIGHIRGLRQHLRTNLEPKAKAYDAFMGNASKLGIDEPLIEPSFQLMSGLLGTQQRPVLKDGQPQYDPTTGQPLMEDASTTLQFWQSLSDLSQPHLKQLLTDAVLYFPEFVAKQIPREAALKSLGLDDQALTDFQRFQQDGAKGFVQSADYDPEVAKSLPDHLREEYRLSDPDMQYGLNQLEPAIRQMMLEQKLQNRQNVERDKKAETDRQQAAQQAQQQAAEKRSQDFVTQKNDAFMSDLAKTWNPFGAGQDAENKRMHRAVWHDVDDALRNNPKTVQLINGINEALLKNNQLAVSSLWNQLNVEVVRMRNEATAFYDQFLRADHAARQQQRDESAKLKAVANTGGMPDNRQEDAIPDDSRSALRAMARQLGMTLT